MEETSAGYEPEGGFVNKAESQNGLPAKELVLKAIQKAGIGGKTFKAAEIVTMTDLPARQVGALLGRMCRAGKLLKLPGKGKPSYGFPANSKPGLSVPKLRTDIVSVGFNLALETEIERVQRRLDHLLALSNGN